MENNDIGPKKCTIDQKYQIFYVHKIVIIFLSFS